MTFREVSDVTESVIAALLERFEVRDNRDGLPVERVQIYQLVHRVMRDKFATHVKGKP